MPRLSEKEMDAITNNFYSCFCGIHLSEAESGISFVCSASRNDALKALVASIPFMYWSKKMRALFLMRQSTPAFLRNYKRPALLIF